MILNENLVNLEGMVKIRENPKEESYFDIFDRFKILVVILYLGNDKHDINITTDIFENNIGKSI